MQLTWTLRQVRGRVIYRFVAAAASRQSRRSASPRRPDDVQPPRGRVADVRRPAAAHRALDGRPARRRPVPMASRGLRAGRTFSDTGMMTRVSGPLARRRVRRHRRTSFLFLLPLAPLCQNANHLHTQITPVYYSAVGWESLTVCCASAAWKLQVMRRNRLDLRSWLDLLSVVSAIPRPKGLDPSESNFLLSLMHAHLAFDGELANLAT